MNLDELRRAHELKQARYFCLRRRKKQTLGLAAPHLNLLWIITLELSTQHRRRGEECRSQLNCIRPWQGWVVCYSEEESSNIPLPCEWGWGSATATDKDLDRDSPGVRTGHLGPFWTCTVQHSVKTHNGVQHVCGSKAWRTIQGHVPGELSVSYPRCLSDLFSSLSLIIIPLCTFKVCFVILP